MPAFTTGIFILIAIPISSPSDSKLPDILPVNCLVQNSRIPALIIAQPGSDYCATRLSII
jgi:hypothetical protein